MEFFLTAKFFFNWRQKRTVSSGPSASAKLNDYRNCKLNNIIKINSYSRKSTETRGQRFK